MSANVFVAHFVALLEDGLFRVGTALLRIFTRLVLISPSPQEGGVFGDAPSAAWGTADAFPSKLNVGS